ncbi:MAG: DUF748 domain-containing protein [Flavobacteriales bacterium]|nr:DUF748 domain-containing protein [Flavobacteriales bacterium]MBK6945365.1 DUF748 domain-containing protein [Flavobacteriales bacterium]MBK7241478.1 DUF748 domain-containing protein [Flavobacteriales bacterium]MBP9139607.1 DUF748 domain-containing protein [Flavobacteriales bacterium]HQV53172.1 DUF748 domain-containing protein [Flavobacteriales bacterium]
MPEVEKSTDEPSENKKHRRFRIIAIIVGILLLLRIALPYVLLRVANDRLSKIPGYYGHIDDLDLAIIRGAYQLERFDLQRVDTVSLERTPFIASKLIDISIEWRALFKGSLVGVIEADEPRLRFTIGAAEPEDVQGDTATLTDVFDDFMPLKLNRVGLRNGRLEYADPGATPPLDMALTELNGEALNLSSVIDKAKVLPSTITATATIYGGAMALNMGLDALRDQLAFDMDLTVEDIELTQVNDFFQAYADFDVNTGSMSVYTELATQDGAFTGYVKPVIKDLDVLGKEDRKDNFFRKLWEGVVGTAAVILKNQKEKQVATKVPLEGRLDDPQVGSWIAIGRTLRNAFIIALQPILDKEITIGDLNKEVLEKDGGFLKNVFGKEENKDKN